MPLFYDLPRSCSHHDDHASVKTTQTAAGLRLSRPKAACHCQAPLRIEETPAARTKAHGPLFTCRAKGLRSANRASRNAGGTMQENTDFSLVSAECVLIISSNCRRCARTIGSHCRRTFTVRFGQTIA